MFLLREAARILSYDEAEEQLGLSAAEFERQYGRADAFTVRRGGECLVCCRMDGNPARLNFTLAHELGHIVLRHDGTSPAEEREADHFASCLLCPEPVRRRLLARTDLAVEDAAALCYLSVAAVQMAMRRRPTAADDALLGRIDALFAEQADAAKPDFSGISRHSLQNSSRFAKKS
ncbi:MAG: ImmA/IrrE family metallo-endopeptidase [Christensenellaceae bacterium]|nr:ImmA/IrrE family metallo-endopeptidase [Christensenellaceae bacterium]